MKLRATIEVEIEANAGSNPEYALRAALLRGRSALKNAIEHGSSSAPSGIKQATVTVGNERIE